MRKFLTAFPNIELQVGAIVLAFILIVGVWPADSKPRSVGPVYEFKVVPIESYQYANEAWLNEMGVKGWTVVAAARNGMYSGQVLYLQRQVR